MTGDVIVIDTATSVHVGLSVLPTDFRLSKRRLSAIKEVYNLL